MKRYSAVLANQDGATMVVAILILALLTIIGLASSNLSTTEVKVATNSLIYERAFYTAEAGLMHAKELLRVPFVEQNAVILAAGGTGNWNFALNGALDGYAAASDSDGDGIGDYLNGVVWIQNQSLNGVRYTVTIWNNDDGGAHNNDTDGLIYVRTDAEGQSGVHGGRCSILILLEGRTEGEVISGYTAQQGAGSGKAYIATDAEAIEFSDPGFGQQL
jgi:hypothetical protein